MTHEPDTTYNGWANWATWNTILWCDNEEPIYRARGCYHPSWTAGEAERFVRGWYPKGTPDMEPNIIHDGPSRAEHYSDVDWQAIADAWNEE